MNDLMNPMNPLSPFSPINPANPLSPFYDDGDDVITNTTTGTLVPPQDAPQITQNEIIGIFAGIILAAYIICMYMDNGKV